MKKAKQEINKDCPNNKKNTDGRTLDMGFANLDLDRGERTGEVESVFSQGKTCKQVGEIMEELVKAHPDENIMATRATEKDFKAVKEKLSDAVYDKEAGIIYKKQTNKKSGKTIVILTAGTSDIPVAREAALTASLLGHEVIEIFDVGVAGVHRLLEREDDIRKGSVVIVVAGMEGAIASVVGGLVDTPVIAVPTSVGYGSSFEGLAALLAMMNSCANGIGVVNIDNGYGAACLGDKIIKSGIKRAK